MTGGAKKFSHRGLIPRAISAIFDELTRRGAGDYDVKVAFLELYKDQARPGMERSPFRGPGRPSP